MRLLITRPRQDALQTAKKLRALGHKPVPHPLMNIAEIAGSLDIASYQAVLITSANGVRALANQATDRSTPLYCVGDASAAEARNLGFTKVTSAKGNVEDLSALVAESLDPANGPLVHVAGESRAGNLKADLDAKGFSVLRHVAYRAELAAELPAGVLENIDGVLFYSPRSARHFAKLVDDAGLALECQTVVAYGLSSAVAAALAPLAFKAVEVAAMPTEDALFALLPKTTNGAQPKAEERNDMVENAGTDTPKITAPKVDLKADKPATANGGGGGGKGGRLGWVVVLILVVAIGGAIGWGALYNQLPDDMRANLPAFLQAPDHAASTTIDDKMLAFDRDVEDALSRIQAAADRAADQQAARLTHLETEIEALKVVAGRNSNTLEGLHQTVLQMSQQDRVQPEDLMRLANQIDDVKASLTQQAQNNIETRDIAVSARRDATAALAAGADAPRRTAFAVALSGLDRAAASGRAFDRELAAANAQAGMEVVGLLAPLREHAPYGVETLNTLTQQFEALARTAMKVDAIPAEAPWYEKLWARLKSIVTVRPVGEVAGNSTGAIISRAEAQLERGDLESAVGTLGALDGAAALTFDKWVQRAKDRLAVNMIMARVALTAQTQAMAVVKPAPAAAPVPEPVPEPVPVPEATVIEAADPAETVAEPVEPPSPAPAAPSDEGTL